MLESVKDFHVSKDHVFEIMVPVIFSFRKIGRSLLSFPYSYKIALLHHLPFFRKELLYLFHQQTWIPKPMFVE